MSRIQIAAVVCMLYAVIGLAVDGSMRPMLILAVVTCGPLLLHYLTNQPSKEASNG